MPEALRVAILGAECTGKSELTLALRQDLSHRTGLRVAAVGEWLSEWCDLHQRTPRPDEQADIALEQQRRIAAASAEHDLVICDTTALMTAVYSLWYFNDRSLVAAAVAAHADIDLILLTSLDIPWQADGIKRDGIQVRQGVDALLRQLLAEHHLPFSVISGQGQRRTDAAVDVVRRMVDAQHGSPTASGAALRSGLFGRLLEPRADASDGSTPDVASSQKRRAWVCECCVPEAERASLRLLRTRHAG